MKRQHVMRFGTALDQSDTHFRLWAPDARAVALRASTPEGERLTRELIAQGDGWYELAIAGIPRGTRYSYRIDDEIDVPDPASRFNPEGVHGPGEVIDPCAFDWQDDSWHGRAWHEAVIYELHVGAFTAAGTFDAIVPRLRELAQLGITAIELMPVAAFSGNHGWGYDGVLPFAPHAAYGRPEDLKRLVQAAHRLNLMVILDVVYNHFGPDGNYLPRYAGRLFTDKHCTPWGNAINFECGNDRSPRQFFIDNALYWLNEYHLDGLRIDAIHAMLDCSSPHIIDELADVMAAGPGSTRHVHLILENYANQARRLTPQQSRSLPGKSLLSKSQWNDDFHHALHVLITGEHDGHYADYVQAPLRQLGRVLAEGFAFQGEPFTTQNDPSRGEPSAHLPPTAFIDFLQNHDQIGNRACGERLAQLTGADQLHAALAILLLTPQPPMLFMGEEYAAPQPFLFFCDYHGELAAAITAGRRNEFAGFSGFSESDALAIADPNDPATFTRSKLDWSDRQREPHAGWLAYIRSLLAIRTQRIVPLIPQLVVGTATYQVTDRVLNVTWWLRTGSDVANSRLVMTANLSDASSAVVVEEGERLFTTFAASTTALQPWEVRLQLHPQ